jgi:hypothetical protein
VVSNGPASAGPFAFVVCPASTRRAPGESDRPAGFRASRDVGSTRAIRSCAARAGRVAAGPLARVASGNAPPFCGRGSDEVWRSGATKAGRGTRLQGGLADLETDASGNTSALAAAARASWRGRGDGAAKKGQSGATDGRGTGLRRPCARRRRPACQRLASKALAASSSANFCPLVIAACSSFFASAFLPLRASATP